MNLKKTLTAVAAMALTATLAFAAPPEGRHGGKHGRHGFGGKLAEKLNLTDAQKEQIKSIRKASFEQNKAFFENARQMRQDLRAAKEANDTARLEALKSTMQSQREQMKQIRDAEKQQILSVLTTEQRVQFEAMQAEHKGRRGGRGHKPRA
jgi:protein CpxP